MSSERDESPTIDRWETLDQALQAYSIPMENWPRIRQIVEYIGIDHYEGIASHRYIKAIRRDGRRMLKIASGFTSGFLTEEEAVAAAGDVARDPSSEGGWYVEHPVNSVGKWYGGSGSKADAGAKREGTCSACGWWVSLGSMCDEAGRPHDGADLGLSAD